MPTKLCCQEAIGFEATDLNQVQHLHLRHSATSAAVGTRRVEVTRGRERLTEVSG